MIRNILILSDYYNNINFKNICSNITYEHFYSSEAIIVTISTKIIQKQKRISINEL